MNLRVSLHELADYINGRATQPAEVVDVGVPVNKIAELSRGITNKTRRQGALRRPRGSQ